MDPEHNTTGYDVLVTVNPLEKAKSREITSRIHCDSIGSYGEYVFLGNNNLHLTPPRMGGVVIFYKGSVGYIVKAMGTKAAFKPLLPEPSDLKLISLLTDNLFVLEQVHGPHLQRNVAVEPRLDTSGHVVASPRGPTILHKYKEPIPFGMMEELEAADWGDIEMFVPKVNPLSKKVQVVYVIADEAKRRTDPRERPKGSYTIPIGNKLVLNEL